MQYVLSAKELTELAKEVAAAIMVRYQTPLPGFNQEIAVKEVLSERGIQWCDDE